MSYWSLSSLAKWIREKAGLTNPYSLTMEGWKDYKEECKQKAPFIYWLTTTGFNKTQDFVSYPFDILYNARCYYRNWKGNTHVLDGNLKKGQWYDLSSRILPCLFEELVKYIEQEKELETLEWETTLVYNEEWGIDPSDEKYGKLTDQAIHAIEQKALYLWYKNIYLKRSDPHDISGLTDFYKEGEGLSKLDESRNKEWKDMYEIYSKIEEDYRKEEEEMIIRLIKIRESLWT